MSITYCLTCKEEATLRFDTLLWTATGEGYCPDCWRKYHKKVREDFKEALRLKKLLDAGQIELTSISENHHPFVKTGLPQCVWIEDKHGASMSAIIYFVDMTVGRLMELVIQSEQLSPGIKPAFILKPSMQAMSPDDKLRDYSHFVPAEERGDSWFGSGSIALVDLQDDPNMYVVTNVERRGVAGLISPIDVVSARGDTYTDAEWNELKRGERNWLRFPTYGNCTRPDCRFRSGPLFHLCKCGQGTYHVIGIHQSKTHFLGLEIMNILEGTQTKMICFDAQKLGARFDSGHEHARADGFYPKRRVGNPHFFFLRLPQHRVLRDIITNHRA